MVIGVYGYLMGDLNYGPLCNKRGLYGVAVLWRRLSALPSTCLAKAGYRTYPARKHRNGQRNCYFLIGLFFVQRSYAPDSILERMKDLFTVQPALFSSCCCLLSCCHLVRISFTDMRMLVATHSLSSAGRTTVAVFQVWLESLQ